MLVIIDSIDFDRHVSIYEKGVWWKKRLHVSLYRYFFSYKHSVFFQRPFFPRQRPMLVGDTQTCQPLKGKNLTLSGFKSHLQFLTLHRPRVDRELADIVADILIVSRLRCQLIHGSTVPQKIHDLSWKSTENWKKQMSQISQWKDVFNTLCMGDFGYLTI